MAGDQKVERLLNRPACGAGLPPPVVVGTAVASDPPEKRVCFRVRAELGERR